MFFLSYSMIRHDMEGKIDFIKHKASDGKQVLCQCYYVMRPIKKIYKQ